MDASTLVKAQTGRPFIRTIDACDSHVEGVFSQIQHDGSNKAIGYFFKELNPCETRYSAIKEEAVLACRNSYHKLSGPRTHRND